MDITTVFALKSDDVDTLQHFTDVLHLLHHRNKNQHRRSVWWRHFSMFRKRLKQVVLALRSLRATPTTHLARTKKRVEDERIKTILEQSLVVWRDVLVPKWQHAFSQVVADGRFSVLGLVLLGILAEACRLLAITAAFDDLGQEEVEKVLEQFAAEEGVQAGCTLDEDLGEVLTRTSEVVDPRVRSGAARVQTTTERSVAPDIDKKALVPTRVSRTGPTAVSGSSSASKIISGLRTEKKKKKAKKGDAIDDLFGGLG
ncbi:hypothetical protein LTR62_008607 [Meristemomyces frigidus]|uniref:RNase MRP protein 1 RNA binding domain-containing protein n=1 Tax=Meristemomyces frigidus TaxID=1508187 RepID=A0AAN7YH39_9PEZI|nr:hypothetical protein LTR62_008607 [Meristemomyces frigidus]